MRTLIAMGIVLGMLGCGGSAFTAASSADGERVMDEAGSVEPPYTLDAAGPSDAAPESGSVNVQTVDPVSEAGLDASHAAADAELPKAQDAGDASDASAMVAVNEFPGSPYGPAQCRSGADCVDGGGNGSQTTCIALEFSESSSPHTLQGQTACLGPSWGGYGVVLCASDLDCAGYSCITESCEVAEWAPYDGGSSATQVGTTTISVSFCQGVDIAPAGCSP
jgi:hypothetical protein